MTFSSIRKKALMATVLVGVAATGLAGCQTAAELAAQISGIETQVQADAQLACGFIPTLATIAAFIPGAGAIIPSAATIAQGICTAIASAPGPVAKSARLRSLRAGGAAAPPVAFGPVVLPNGVVVPSISGQFVH